MYNIIYIKNNKRHNTRSIVKQSLEVTYTQFPIKTKSENNPNFISLERNKYDTMLNEINNLNRNLINSNKLSEKYKNDLNDAIELKKKYNLLLLEMKNLNNKRNLDIKQNQNKNSELDPKFEHMLSRMVDSMVDNVVNDEVINNISDKIITELFLNA